MEDFKNTILWDSGRGIEERLDYLLQEMTLEEKITCLTTGCPDIPRLGVQAFYMGGEAAHGIEARHDQAFNAGEPEPATSFTQPIGMSASFDRELIKKCGQSVGEEARALYTRNGKGGLCRWAPTIDMERDPRWGRTEEAYGEDAYLAGEMASAYIKGMKGEHPFYIRCGATLKHFYANNVEKDRIKISSSLDGRNKHEYYLEPFRKAIAEGGAEAVMTSYNEINGVPAIVNGEVQNLLKDTWGLPGHVVCDGGDFGQTVNDHKYFKTHAETLAYGLKAGVDCFTDDGEVVYEAAREALKQGLITEEDINKSVRNSFRTRIRLGLFDKDGDCPYTGMGEAFINNEEHKRSCLKMAEESVVLLKNEKHTLPILPEQVSSLAVVGPLADVWYKDWYCGVPPYFVTPLAGIKQAYPKTEIAYHSGLSKIRLRCGEHFIGIDGQGRLCLSEPGEQFTFTDWGCGSMTLTAESNGKFVTLEEGTDCIKAAKKEAFGWFIRESWNLKPVKEDSEQYVINSWNGKQVIVEDDGFLALRKEESTKSPAVFSMEIVEDGIAEAVRRAAKAEKAVVVIGCNPVINSKEEIDRTTLLLPPAQQRLADKVREANPDTVIVLVTNYPYSINKMQEEFPAILCTASGSQELGAGIANVLCGKTSPAGRLPMTWYRSEEDLPDMDDYDIIKGGRTYQYFEKEVLYPFGHGLSYAEFAYGKLKAEPLKEGIRLTVSVTNKGSVKADEVVQIYVHKEKSRVKQPISQLKAFERLKDIEPGEERRAEFFIKYEDLKYYDVISEKMILEDSEYTFMAGSSSKDIREKVCLAVKGETASSRNLFRVTKAVQYDEYENCFIHRGSSEHTIEERTCVIPGKPGDMPEEVKEQETDKQEAVLWYRDAMFEKQPKEAVFYVCGVENGSITLEFNGKSAETMEIPFSNPKFYEVRTALPEDFAKVLEKGTLTVRIQGKIKLAEFYFC